VIEDSTQLDLVPPDELAAAELSAEAELERTGSLTLDRVLRLRPAHVLVARRLLSAGVGIRATAAACGLGVHTVSRIREDLAARGPAGKEDVLRGALSDESRRAALLCAERVSEVLAKPHPDTPVRDLATAARNLAELAELLSGRATARIELAGPTPDDLRAAWREVDITPAVVVTPPCARPREDAAGACTTGTTGTTQTGQEAEIPPPQPAHHEQDATCAPA
jgi:hypothetical protein